MHVDKVLHRLHRLDRLGLVEGELGAVLAGKRAAVRQHEGEVAAPPGRERDAVGLDVVRVELGARGVVAAQRLRRLGAVRKLSTIVSEADDGIGGEVFAVTR